MSGRLVLITTNTPFVWTGGEAMFVLPELPALVGELGRITLVPQHAKGEQLAVPAAVDVDLGLASALSRERWSRYLGAVTWPGFWPELRRGARRGGWKGVVRVWRWAALAQVTYRWLRHAFPAGSPVVFYTYWRGGSTLALARWVAERGASAAITRVHRYELYEESFDPPFQPWHPEGYRGLLLTVPVSQHGVDYLASAGVPLECLLLSRLGTPAPLRLALPSRDGVTRLVSCSNVTAVKRVPLIAASLISLASRFPAVRLLWTHFGDGPELGEVRRLVAAAPANFQAVLAGRVSNEAVMGHYASSPVDLYLLLSKSEGLPVSIQEATSVGVPIVATDVGGVRELVGSDNGVLLPSDPQVDTVVDALRLVLLVADDARRAAMREASRRRWEEGFDAEVNHSRLASKLGEMLAAIERPREQPADSR